MQAWVLADASIDVRFVVSKTQRCACDIEHFVFAEQVPRVNFDSFLNALLAVFQMLTGEDWNVIMYNAAIIACRIAPCSKLSS